MKLSVIIPVFNEARTILEVIEKVKGAPFDRRSLLSMTPPKMELVNSLRNAETE